MNKQQITNNIVIPNKDAGVLKKYFSYCFDKNGNFDFEKFKQELSKNEIDFSKESYGMDWLGKSYARLLASDEATTLLKECEKWNKKAENKNSKNLLIKGDNLEVLKHLSNAYYEKIKMIYIDPPYNTGSDGFVYQDDRKFDFKELSKLAGVDEDKAKRILEFTQSKSNSHSAWLTFMYPRLYIAKQLLKDDGVIFVSIDDNEVAQLRLLMDEIFGEENFVATVNVYSNPRGRQSSKNIAETHEYVLIFSKSEKTLLKGEHLTDKQKQEYNKKDNMGVYREIGLRKRGSGAKKEESPTLFFPIYYDENKNLISLKKENNFIEIIPKLENGDLGRWRWSKEKIVKDSNLLFVRKVKRNGRFEYDVFEKDYLKDNKTRKIKSSWIEKEINYDRSSDEQRKILGNKLFDYAKPVYLLKKIINLSTNTNDLILDFFAGSGTTGDAVMQLNAEDGDNRKYILVQLPEKIDKKKNKTAYDFVKDELGVEKPTIFEITKERLIRTGKKMQEDNEKLKDKDKKDLSNVDFGFKIFETTPIWEDYNLEAERFDSQTKLFDENKLSDEDLKILLTTWKTYDGIALTQDLTEINLDGYKGHYFDNKLYLIDKGFKTKNLKKFLEEIDSNKDFNPVTIIIFGYNFESKVMREIAENVKNYANKKQIDIDFVTRY